jgi:hypothetical protein
LDIDHLAGLVVERANARLRRDENRHLDRVARRIAWLVDHSLIEKRRDKASGNVLYADAGDRRLWEFTVRRLHGSGFNSPRLSVISEEEAAKKYCSSSTQDDLPDVVSAGPVAVDADDEKRQDNQEQRVQGPSPGEATRWPA